MSFFLPQNPGIGGLDELTTSEEAAIQLIAGLGSPNQALRTNAAGDGLEWFTLGGGTGDVTKVGTPVDNQVGVWTGDGTIEGTANFTHTGNILTTTNTTDQASNQVLILQGDRATPTANDEVYASFKLSDSAGNQDEFARITGRASTVTSTSEVGRLVLSVMDAGTLTQKVGLTPTTLYPVTTDTVALGTTANSFSDLFLAGGGVINWNNGNATLTHSAGLLTSNVPVSLGTTNALTAGSIELGHASDTTITRTGAGAIAVEGVEVALNSTSLAHTAFSIELGHASDTTLTRVSAGVVAIEGTNIVKAGAVTTNGITMSTARVLGRTTAATGAIEELSTVDTFVSAASDTAAGKVELAIASEINTGTDATRAVTPDSLAGSYAGTKSLSVQVTDGTTSVATGDGKAYITIPESLNGMNLIRAQATVVTAGTTNATTVMIHNVTDTQDMLSGAISIASAGTVGTVGTINTTYDDVSTNDILRVDIDSVSTTPPKGLMVVLEFRLP